MKYLVVFMIFISNAFAINEITKVDMYLNCGATAPKDKIVTVHYMDCDKILTKQLNNQLRQLGHPTKKEITSLTSKFMKKHKDEYEQAYQSKAQSHNIKSYPAIVINDKYIVYGTNSYSEARSEYFRYKG